MKVFVFLCVLCVLLPENKCTICTNQVRRVQAFKSPEDFIQNQRQRILPLKDFNSNYLGIKVVNTELSYICKEFFRTLNHVEYVSFEGNQINQIEAGAFEDLADVAHIQLKSNKLIRVDVGIFENIPSLNQLYLDNNKITLIDDEAFKNLPELEELNLSLNNIQTISNKWFINCPNIKKLDLSFNKIKTVPARAFEGLPSDMNVKIILASNSIEEIEEGAFENLQKIAKIQLRDNSITELPNMFGELIYARKLLLNRNSITCVPDEILDMFGKFNEVRIKRNPIADDCVLKNETALKKYTTKFEL